MTTTYLFLLSRLHASVDMINFFDVKMIAKENSSQIVVGNFFWLSTKDLVATSYLVRSLILASGVYSLVVVAAL